MVRRLLPVAFCSLFAAVVLQASPLTVYFTGTCSDCTGTGVNGTVLASITFTSAYFYNINGPEDTNGDNLAYGEYDAAQDFWTGQDTNNSSIAPFVYDGSNKQAAMSTSSPYETSLSFGWTGTNPFPGPQNAFIEWGNPSTISYSFDTGYDGTWDFTVTDNETNHHTTEDSGTDGSWSFSPPPPSPVPEPTTLAEMAGGLGLLGILAVAGKLRA